MKIRDVFPLCVCIAPVLAAGFFPAGRARALEPEPPSAPRHVLSLEETAVQQASDQFYAALNAVFTGDIGPMTDVWSHSAEVTNMGPFGGRLVGWDAVRKQFEREAGLKLGGKVACKDPFVAATADLGYTLCTEKGENLTAAGKAVQVEHRATNIFRRMEGKWKLVHHHTDLSSALQAITHSKPKK